MDVVTAAISFSLTYWIFMNLSHAAFSWQGFVGRMLVCISVTSLFFLIFKIHSGIIRYAGTRDAFRIFCSLFCSSIVLILVHLLMTHYGKNYLLPGMGFLIYAMMTFTFLFFSKFSIRLMYDYVQTTDNKHFKSIPALMYGVAPANLDLMRLINHTYDMSYYIIGFIVVGSNPKNKRIYNLPIYDMNDAFHDEECLSKFQAVIIDPKQIDIQEKHILAEKCIQTQKTLLSPLYTEEGNLDPQKISKLEKIKFEDLLHRDPIEIDLDAIAQQLSGKTIMITGAAGSIGSEIVRQVCKFGIRQVLLCDVAESPLHNISMELQDKYPHINQTPLIADVRNLKQMESIFRQYQPQIVYHAAAYKHVPLMELYPCEAILTNVQGSQYLADLAAKYHVEVFVMISTDKAVNPSNVMGASKRIAEMYVQSLSKKQKEELGDKATKFITTRFGNVLGSNGSVIARFEQQISAGGPLTVTHPDIIRYFMTISEACRLVLDAGNFGKGGEVFVFDMGQPVKIKDMAEMMIKLSGFTPYKDIDIIFTGLRPGEKLYEELLYDRETVQPTHNQKIMIGQVKTYDYKYVQTNIAKLIDTARSYNHEATVKLMKKIVPEFISLNSLYDVFDKK
jgi:FlaA1/EpsC-like NDP-sugar epimerase